ncbi:MAG: hypothetical protein JWN72_2306 [Thermoleophilia bacterium]|nr:hypothetical protein [Thermoleophilia bacterium]
MTETAAITDPVAIEHFALPTFETTPAAQLRAIRDAVPGFKEWFRATGTASAYAPRSLITVPYPMKYGFYEACTAPVPYVWFINRMFLVQWVDAGGDTRTLLYEPSDYDLGIETPFFRREYDKFAKFSKAAAGKLSVEHKRVHEHLADFGLEPTDIDYIAFDHMHTQDIRRIVGTTEPAPDLGFHTEPVPAAYPNARVIIAHDELTHVRDVHPFQQRFFQSGTYDHIREEQLLFVDNDVLLGPGVALLRTPGHTLGNFTLTVNTERGIFTSSENGIAAECYAPEHSKLPGVAKWAKQWNYEVVMNFNTPEYASLQYNSMVKEKLIADPVPGREQFPQVFPTSEFTKYWMAPGIKPTYEHGELTLGTVRRPS